MRVIELDILGGGRLHRRDSSIFSYGHVTLWSELREAESRHRADSDGIC
jgi:hypothetical protein